MSPELLTVLAAAAALTASSTVRIALPGGRTIVPLAAVAPAVIALGPDGFALTEAYVLLVLVLLADVVALIFARDSWKRVLWHPLLFGAGFAVFRFRSAVIDEGASRVSSSASLMAAVSVVAILFMVATLPIGNYREQWSFTGVRELLWSAAPVAAVLVSISNVIVFVYPLLGWFSFVVLLIPLVATAWEYDRFREAERTYEETVRALGRLTERAGYAEVGHHEAVADLASAIAKEARLSEEEIRELRLVALMHDAGAVSLAYPQSGRDHTLATARILQETGYLERWADHLPGGSNESSKLSLEAQILLAADRLDGILRAGPTQRAIEELMLEVPDIVEPCRRVLALRWSA